MKPRITRRPKAASDPVPAPAPVITPYEKIATQLIAAITDAVNQLPGFHDDLSGIAKPVRRKVTPQFLGMTIAAVEASSELQGVNQLDPVETRDSMQFSQAIQPLIDELFGVGRRLDLIKRFREAKAGTAALGTYDIAKRIVKNPNNTHLVVHVENMKAELLRTKLNRRKAKTGPVTPAPAAEGGATTDKAS
jgi:hypothetical protein